MRLFLLIVFAFSSYLFSDTGDCFLHDNCGISGCILDSDINKSDYVIGGEICHITLRRLTNLNCNDGYVSADLYGYGDTGHTINKNCPAGQIPDSDNCDCVPICPPNSHYDSNQESCVCDSGYHDDPSHVGLQCVGYTCPSTYNGMGLIGQGLTQSDCTSRFGSNPGQYQNGYYVEPEGSGTSCCYASNPVPDCGSNASYNVTTHNCECDSGYHDDPIQDGFQCVDDNSSCPSNAHWDSSISSCKCNDGYGDDPSREGLQCTFHVECGDHAHYDDFQNSCVCDAGYALDGNQCKFVHTCQPNAHYVESSDSCVCDNGYIQSGNDCIDRRNKCNYPGFKDNYVFQSSSNSQSECNEQINEYGGGHGTYYKLDTCDYGACYYDYLPGDGNSSADGNGSGGGSGGYHKWVDNLPQNVQKILDKLDEVKLSIDDKNLSVNVDLNSVNTRLDTANVHLSNIESNLSGINTALHSTITKFKPVELNDFNRSFDSGTASDIDSMLNSVDLNSSISLVESAISQYSDFVDHMNQLVSSLKDDYNNYMTILHGDLNSVSLPSSSCSLTAVVFGKQLDFGSSLCSALNLISPYVAFVLTLITQFSLLILGIKLLKVD